MKKQSKIAKFSKQSRITRFGIPTAVILVVALLGVHFIAGSHADSDSIHCAYGTCGPGETEDRNGQFMVALGLNRWVRMYGGSPPPITNYYWYSIGSYARHTTWQVWDAGDNLCLKDSDSYIIQASCNTTASELFMHVGDRIANLAATENYGCSLCGELYATGEGGSPVRVANINSGSPDTNFDSWFLL